MEQLVNALSDHFVASIFGVCFLAAIGVRGVIAIVTTNGRERSRREIAAYIAEGSLTPEQGERLLRADVNRGQRLG
ncbi:MAG: hypothetical protein ACYTGC_18035 [Planctomycetota bacterium]|jgi:hypothetical protein